MYIAISADHALLQSTPPTALTQNQAVLLMSLIHGAFSVIGLRPLQTGTAKDVTGVMRVTRGGAWYDFISGNRDTGEPAEWEMLYRLEDGRAKLFKHA
jgi:elongator complex protein 6